MKKVKKMISALAATALLFGFGLTSCSNGGDDDVNLPVSGPNGVPQGQGENQGGGQGGNTPSNTVTGKVVVNDGVYTFETPDLNYTFSLEGTALAGKTATWTSGNDYVVKVDSTGMATSLAGGTTKITATADGASVDFNVKVPDQNRTATTDPFDLKTLNGEDLYVIMCGDSIMRDYGAASTDQCGLGQVMKYFFNNKVTVNNSISNGGRSSRLFWNEASRWPEVQKILTANKAAGKKTVVFFSFGHNDQRTLTDVYNNTTTGEKNLSQFTFAETNQNGTVAGTHYDYMERYIIATRELGGVPICVSPFARSDFSGDAVSEKGKHNMETALAGEEKGRGNYPKAMKAAAAKQNAIFVDMTNMSAEWAAKINAAGKVKYGYIVSDNTHETTLGALRLAEMVTGDLKKQGYLTNYIVTPNPRIMVTASSLAFGRMNPQVTKTLSFKVSSFNATTGTITITAPDGYNVSLSAEGAFTKSVTINCTENFIGEEVFVQFAPTEAKEYNGNLTVTHSTITPDFGNTPAGTIEGTALLIALTGAGKAKVVGGEAATVLWPMIDSSNKFLEDATVTPEGTLTASKAKLVGLTAVSSDKRGTFTKVNNVKTYDNPDEAKYTARVCIDGGTWPVNDAGVALNGQTIGGKEYNVYLEYAIPVNGVDFTVNKISMLCGSSGSGNMKWSVYYSTDSEFKNPTPIVEIDGVTKNGEYKTVTTGTEDLALTVSSGTTLYVRVYPAFKSTKDETGRNFFIGDVTVTGVTN
ncbi:MAG: hypothetical protein IJS09_00280 [Treponema sp.]|nr:hypothetical protein [Treponema sp.]